MLALLLFLLVVVIIFHFDIPRYLLLHTNSIVDKLIKNYMKIPHHTLTNKVIVSLTTTSNRITKIKPMLASLLDQSVRVDKIVLNLVDGVDYKIDETLKNMVEIIYSGKDYGKGTKCIPTLLREGDKNTIIIMLDDDYIYGENFIETLLKMIEDNPDTILYKKGIMILKPEYVDYDIVDSTRKTIDDNCILKYVKQNINKKRISYNLNFKSNVVGFPFL
jgi:hypothetical protein